MAETLGKNGLEDVPQDVRFPAEEEKILAYWDHIDAFQTSLKTSREEGRPEFTFYDGPPFATGMPHYGHILAGTIKDCITRYWHMNGFHVERKWGWDTHGLPVEYEIDQKLGIKSRDDVLKMTVAKYNAECRSVVMRYASEWKRVVRRLARWIDMENDYKTLDPTFMETVWWVCKQMFDKDLIYRGYKVMPYSTACSTPLSNFEAGQNYKDVSDPECVVSLPIIGSEPPASMLAWTTTPWTLPSNLALCVHPTMEYAYVEDVKTSAVYVLAVPRLVQLYKKESEYKVLKTVKGQELRGLKYEPLFNFFVERKGDVGFRVLCDEYVTADSGTGIVHQAPAFGEDDYRVCLKEGVIFKGEHVPCPVDADGRFTEEVSDFQGQHVKEADKAILASLKASGRLVKSGAIKHSYPFCWRSDTPLIYKAVPSWFVKVETLKEKLLANNDKTYWVPDFVKEKRFHNWLAGARDWAISRNRFWGTPIPIWHSEDWEEVICVGSVDELEQLSGVRVNDLHKDSIDHITIPSKMGKGELRRVEEVFDCWFESGSMPYAQCHYPFENKEKFEKTFPADFIAEGLDQTRGWFYTLMVIGTALFDKPAFKNVIVNGLVLAEDGKKMSKRLKNYPDPELVINSHGADALRMYLINSPVVRGEELRFKEQGVKDVVRDVFLPWYNAYRFLIQVVRRLQSEEGVTVQGSGTGYIQSDNTMDQWIQAAAAGLLQFVQKEMQAYRLYTVVPRLLRFMEDLTNWYVKMNRKRLKGGAGVEEATVSIRVLLQVLLTLVRSMAPFTPMFCELLYMNLRNLLPESERKDSVHYLDFPQANLEAVNERMELKVRRMQVLIEKGRIARDKRGISLRTPIRAVTVICPNTELLQDIEDLKGYVLEELNVRSLSTTTEEGDMVTRSAAPDNTILGRRLGKAFKEVSAKIKTLTNAELMEYERKGQLDVCGSVLSGDDLKITRSFNGDTETVQAESYDEVLALFDVGLDESLRQEGAAREIVSRVQQMRKKAGLLPEDLIEVFYESSDESFLSILANHMDTIKSAIRVELLPRGRMPGYLQPLVILQSEEDVNGMKISLTITRACLHVSQQAADVSQGVSIEALQSAVMSLQLASAKKSMTSGAIQVAVDGKQVELQAGKHVWASRHVASYILLARRSLEWGRIILSQLRLQATQRALTAPTGPGVA
ncbi:hypothetical protein GUITHDRAFT_132515 [Guillardia theta CCMP2712]|uniref:isoleucine--tRNA ligase n=1 Tax=Guillardia theta (strain CCMP2712) TaxID=905079 RepID=L1K156_GUITC|nr:hypothetical protein GUITHDRAFT_132515 [Guillardia theta CCMP2712]EKX54118.1 hypothetical protein GUITHDRAFT_132515 [Guillardia theta CCMP2712]|eukprot:XP_005841098.1 hypothetical protein GUITHDRAFT_132515 [Guillardia theta CCMP2712]